MGTCGDHAQTESGGDWSGGVHVLQRCKMLLKEDLRSDVP